jgi:hypothetical protein
MFSYISYQPKCPIDIAATTEASISSWFRPMYLSYAASLLPSCTAVGTAQNDICPDETLEGYVRAQTTWAPNIPKIGDKNISIKAYVCVPDSYTTY